MCETIEEDFENTNFASDILSKLYNQKNSEQHCDLTIVVNNHRTIFAHSNVIACSSPFFDNLFKNYSYTKRKMKVSCLDVETFNHLIDFMYLGHLKINHDNATEVLKLSTYFQIDKAVTYSMEFLKKAINVKNCFQFRQSMLSYDLKPLKDYIRDFMRARIKEICQEKEICDITIENLYQFLNDKDFILPTAHYLDVITTWTNANLECREEEMPGMLQKLDWARCDPIEVFTHLDGCILYQHSLISLYHVLKHLNDHSIFIPTYETRYQQLREKFEEKCLTTSFPNRTNLETDVRPNPDISVEIEFQDYESGNNKTSPKPRPKKVIKKLTLYRGARPGVRLALLRSPSSMRNRILKLYKEVREDSETDQNEGIRCPFCTSVLSDTQSLEHHMSVEHSKDITYRCGVCNYHCQWNHDYLAHMKEHFPGPNFKCDSCEYESTEITELLAHRVKHCDENTFQCTFCTFKCRLKQNFLSHLRIHCPDKPYKCDFCDATFRFKQLLDSHVLTHNDEENMTCDSCGFHTKLLSHLIAHKRIHTSDLHKCTYPHCKYSTAKKSQLINHSKIHSGVRPHSCNVCGRGFMEKSHLVRHERIHLDEKPFKCGQCDYASSRRDKLKEHFTRHHGESASAKVPYKARPVKNSASNSNGTQNHRQKVQQSQESNGSNLSYPTSSPSTSGTVAGAPITSDIQELIMHHQNLPSTSTANNIPAINTTSYHHFPEAGEFHGHAAHGIPHGPLPPHSTASAGHHPRPHHTTSASTAAAVAAMMLDPRFHHNTGVPYHPSNTPVSMAMAAVQSSQHMQNSVQHSEYPTHMSLF